ncbi:MAG: hypothetical protein V3R27_10440, partial [Pseudomonadales bacterium]
SLMSLIQSQKWSVTIAGQPLSSMIERGQAEYWGRSGDVFSWRMAGDMLQPDQPDYDRAAKVEALFRAAHEGFYR